MGFYLVYNPLRCEQICGDGILHDLPCDDGNTDPNDGCSPSCTIEENYACINGSVSSSSVCSYNGTISLSFQTGIKNPTSNSMTLTYKIEPVYPLYYLNNGSTDFSSLVSFPQSSGVTVTSVEIDPVTN